MTLTRRGFLGRLAVAPVAVAALKKPKAEPIDALVSELDKGKLTKDEVVPAGDSSYPPCPDPAVSFPPEDAHSLLASLPSSRNAS